jgi:pectate lyase
MTVRCEGSGQGTDPTTSIFESTLMPGFVRSSLAPLALMSSAAACTLTADDYSPTLASMSDSPGTPCRDGDCSPDPVTTAGGLPEALPVPSMDAIVEADDRPSAVPEAPGMDVPLANDTGEVPGDTGAEVPGAGMPDDPDSEVAIDEGLPPAARLPQLIGWAGVSGLDLSTTTGGGAAPPILVRTAEELVELAARPEPLTLAIDGTLDVPHLELASDKTLYGLSDDSTLRGGIGIRGAAGNFVRNVIVNNLRIDASTSALEGDGVQIGYAHHVWIDHCEISNAADGLIEIVRGSDFVTVSHTRFAYAAAAPDRPLRVAALVGHDVGNVAEDAGHLNVTWFHNWWSDNVPHALIGRFGSIHLFNNLFASPGNQSVLAAGTRAQFLLENNAFVGVASPHAILPNSSAILEASGNAYIETVGAREIGGTAAALPYEYPLNSFVAALITAEAGPRAPTE